MRTFEIVSGFTTNTPYEIEIENLKRSLLAHGFSDLHIVGFENRGTWEKNCQEKAIIILDKMLSLKTNIVWLDADAELFGYPSLFDNIEHDIAFCYYGELLSGTLFFKFSDASISILQEWIQSNKNNPSKWDQKVLQSIIEKNNIPFTKLPISYCKTDRFPAKVTIIGQNQASRRFKYMINKNSNFEKTQSLSDMFFLMKKGWKSGLKDGTVCGIGSTLKYTQNFRDQLSTILTEYHITSINDAGCGDMHWISLVNLQGIEYKPFDIIPKNDSVCVMDITSQKMPYADLILCRDVIWHLSNDRIKNMLSLFKSSKAKYLLMNFVLSDEPNIDLVGKSFRRINMLTDPFNLVEPLKIFCENIPDKRYVGLWDLSKIKV